MGILSRLPIKWMPPLIAALLTAFVVGAEARSSVPPRPTSLPSIAEGADARAVRSARAAQNRAIARLDTAAVASFWTEDVEIRRGLGVLVTGRDAYQKLFNPDSGAIARGDELIYQREPV